MANKMRYRWGETNPVEVPVNANQAIEIGDMLWLDTDDAKPASGQSDQGSLAANQDLFASKFLGVAMQAHGSAEAAKSIRVATTGVFEFDCASATFVVGDKVGAAENGDGDALEDQTVIEVTSSPGKAIGRVAKSVVTAATTVLVDIVSTVMRGGVEGTSASGM